MCHKVRRVGVCCVFIMSTLALSIRGIVFEYNDFIDAEYGQGAGDGADKEGLLVMRFGAFHIDS